MVTHGSRGDVQPFAALAKRLHDSGHSVTLAAPAESTWLAEPYCERVVKVHDGPNLLATDPDVVKGLETGFHGLQGRRRLATTIPKTRRLVREVMDDLAEMAHELAAEGGQSFDVAVHHVSGAGHDVAEFLGVPSALMCPQPYWVRTSSFPDPSFPYRVPRQLNEATYFASKAIWWLFSGSTTRWRRESLGLSRRRQGRFRQADGSPRPVLHPFSPSLLPPATSYPSWVQTTGFWFLPSQTAWRPEPALSDFLDNGQPPVYLGFASTVSSDPRRLAQLVREAVRQAGVRAVVVGGWSGIEADHLGGEIAFVKNAPFDWLFERVAAVVHHGGLGTTGVAMASGRPQVVCPLLPDQRFSARRMNALGVAPAPVHQREMSAEKLAAAIRQAVADDEMARRAMRLAERVRAENGVAAAEQVLLSLAKGAAVSPATREID